MALLTLNNVSKSFAEQSVVNNLSLEIEAGAFVALLGPSGCGKSTTLRMLAGFEQVSQGSIYHGEQCLSQAGTHVPAEQRNFGMVFQSYALWPHMSVEDNIGYPLQIKGVKASEKRQRINEALEIVQLAPFAKRLPADLSGGQRQRVALARSLVTEPQVVLLDEPLANLDRHLRATMEETFRLFHQRTGSTMVYVTHDQGEAMSLADKIAVLKNGELLQWCSPSELYQQPKNAWLANFIGRGSIVQIAGAIAGQRVDRAIIQQQLLTNSVKQNATQVLIRPESLHLDPSEGIHARISNCIYRGERYDVELTLLDGQILQAYHQQPLIIGQHIYVQCGDGWALEPTL